jgi:hypothetical protein
MDQTPFGYELRLRVNGRVGSVLAAPKTWQGGWPHWGKRKKIAGPIWRKHEDSAHGQYSE